jgi:hypothetical protein
MILIKHIKDTPVPPSAKNPNVQMSPELEGIAMRCLQKDPAARFQTAEEFGSALNAVPLMPGGEVIKMDPAAAKAWDFTTVVQPGPAQQTVLDRTVPTQAVSPGAPTIVSAPTIAATAPVNAPTLQQKTAVGQTAPPLPTVIAPAPTVAATVAKTVVAPMSTMSAPPVVADAQPSAAPVPTPAPAPARDSSSMTPILIAAAVLVVVLIGGGAYWYSRSSSTATTANNTAPVTTTAASTSTPSTPPPSDTAPPPSNPTSGGGASATPPAGNPPAVSEPPAGNPPPTTTTAGTVPTPPPPPTPVAAGRRGAPDRPAPSGGRPGRAEAAPVGAALSQPPVQPAQNPPVAAFPPNPAVAFRCVGPNEVCSAIRLNVEEALAKAGMRALRDPGRADVVVEANVTPVSEHVNNDFGTTLAVRTFTIDLISEAPKLGDSIPMPSVSQLSYDPRFGAERVNEKARLVADGVVEKIKAFAAKQK